MNKTEREGAADNAQGQSCQSVWAGQEIKDSDYHLSLAL